MERLFIKSKDVIKFYTQTSVRNNMHHMTSRLTRPCMPLSLTCMCTHLRLGTFTTVAADLSPDKFVPKQFIPVFLHRVNPHRVISSQNKKRSTLHPQIIKRWLSNTSKNRISKSATHEIRIWLSHLVKRMSQDIEKSLILCFGHMQVSINSLSPTLPSHS